MSAHSIFQKLKSKLASDPKMDCLIRKEGTKESPEGQYL